MTMAPISRNEALKAVNEESNRVISWSLLIIGGSLLAFIHKDYLKWVTCYRYFYFIYVLGWASLCISIYWGQRITRNYLASMFVGADQLNKISELANTRFKKQLSWFMTGVIVFAIWIIFFLTIWIFDPESIKILPG